ncbi:hypothetical protein [Sporosarcina sp. ACRSL]|uniref:hypothetical protein n=1 Tax=Sporosarcina sp. ACRSL TaxID=2918215 RepID=UPI001EF4C119|nr:hypothetical protein [Sporosarcina sp. ACRSL]
MIDNFREMNDISSELIDNPREMNDIRREMIDNFFSRVYPQNLTFTIDVKSDFQYDSSKLYSTKGMCK